MTNLHSRVSTPSRFKALAIAITALLGSTSCDRVHGERAFAENCVALDLCDHPTKPPVAVDVLVDASRGSTGTRENFERALDVVLPYAAERPGTVVRVWALAVDVGGTHVVAEQLVPPQPKGSEKAREAHVKRFVATAKALLTSSMIPTFAVQPIRRSPLAAALSKVALRDAGGLPRRVVVLSDAREMSDLLDAECGALPKTERFLALLERKGLLSPGSFKGVRVQFSFVEARPIPGRGCTVTLDREVRIRALWTAALEAAGAEHVRIAAGPPVLAGDSRSDHATKEPSK